MERKMGKPETNAVVLYSFILIESKHHLIIEDKY